MNANQEHAAHWPSEVGRKPLDNITFESPNASVRPTYLGRTSHENPNPFPSSFSEDHRGDEDLACAGAIVLAMVCLLVFFCYLLTGAL